MGNLDLTLEHKWFKKNLVAAVMRDDGGGVKYVFRFKNGYGASVIKNKYSYGNEDNLWELAVIEFTSRGTWHLCHNDVAGYLSNRQVRALLKRIKRLPKALK